MAALYPFDEEDMARAFDNLYEVVYWAAATTNSDALCQLRDELKQAEEIIFESKEVTQ